MINLQQYLEKLGFSYAASSTYIHLVSSGPQTIAQLANKMNTNRTALYSHINSLLEKGVIGKSTGKSSIYFANPPEDLHILIEQQAIQVDILKNKLPNVIQELNNKREQKKFTAISETRYYQGRNSVKSIYNDVLRSIDICAYFDAEDLDKIYPENKFKFNNSVLQHSKRTIREIVRKTPTAITAIKEAQRLGASRHIYKFFPEDLNLTANDILLYDGKVAIINTADKDNVTGVVLHNRDYYNNSKQIFDLLWRLLPDVNIE